MAADDLPEAQTMAPRQVAQPAVVAGAAPEPNSELEQARRRAARLAESTRTLATRLRHAERQAADAKAAERSEVALREAAQQVAATRAAELRDANRRLAAAEREARRDDRRDRAPENLAAGSLADLRERLDRLPAGHPSSPRHDDGTAKEPPPQLKQLELTPPGPDRPAVGGRSDESGDFRRASEPMRAITPADGANGNGGRSGADVASLLEQAAAS